MREWCAGILFVVWISGAAIAAPAQDSQVVLAAGVRQLQAVDLKARLDAKAKTLIVDVRDVDEFQHDTIPTAINIPLETLDHKLHTFPKDALLVFICTSGSLSSRAAKLAQENGFRTATFSTLRDWKGKGYKTTHGRP